MLINVSNYDKEAFPYHDIEGLGKHQATLFTRNSLVVRDIGLSRNDCPKKDQVSWCLGLCVLMDRTVSNALHDAPPLVHWEVFRKATAINAGASISFL